MTSQHVPRMDPLRTDNDSVPFSNAVLSAIFNRSPPLPRVPETQRHQLIFLLKQISQTYLVGWRRNSELQHYYGLLGKCLPSEIASAWISALSEALEPTMKAYVSSQWSKIDHLARINRTEMIQLKRNSSTLVQQIMKVQIRMPQSCRHSEGSKPEFLPMNFPRARQQLPKECRKKARFLWKKAISRVRERLLIARSRTTRTFKMLVAGHNLLAQQRAARKPAAGAKIIYFLGGGMGAGKSTIVRSLFGSDPEAVLIGADDFKFKDPVWDRLPRASSQLKLAVHRSSTRTAESLLLSCISNGRSVILDGTLSWYPFLEQTVRMIRDVKNHRFYRVGPGYRKEIGPDGKERVVEKYWEVGSTSTLEQRELAYAKKSNSSSDKSNFAATTDREDHARGRPYRIEIIGVVCDPVEAVLRAFRRQVDTGRGVPLRSQLRSHKLFAKNVVDRKMMRIVDRTRVYDSTSSRQPKIVIDSACSSDRNILNAASYSMIERTAGLNSDATGLDDLYDGTAIRDGGASTKEESS